MSSGVSGALFFTPFFMFIVGLSPSQAIGAGLLTEVFGMGNGMRSYIKQGVVDFSTAKWLLLGSVPAIIAGSLIAHIINPGILKGVFGAGLILLGGFLVFYPAPGKCRPDEFESEYIRDKTRKKPLTVVETNDGQLFRYKTCWRPPGVALSSIGGFITGIISAGLPEILTTQLIIRCCIPPRVAIGTSVFVLGVTAMVGSVIHAVSATPVWHVVAWSIPGVLIGGYIGTKIAKYLPEDKMEIGLGAVFITVRGLVLSIQIMA